MAKLTADEAKALKQLQDKAKAPEPSGASKTLNVSIDLGDEAQVARAQRLGLLDAFEDEGDGDDGDDGETETPKRRSYFGDE